MKQNIKLISVMQILIFVLIIWGFMPYSLEAQKKTTSPQDYFGFQLGSDKKIARWDKIVDYFNLMAQENNKLKVIDMGPSTLGNPFLLVIISSPENLANLERLQVVNAKLSDPRGIAEPEIKKLVN